MKKIISAVMAVFFIIGGLSAQNKVAIGYCEDKLGGTIIAQDPTPHEFGAAIYVPSEYLNKYAGSTINRIDFAIGDVAGDIMTVFITRDFDGKDLCFKKITDFKKGWNSVELNKTYTIKEGDNLYIGYRYYTTPETTDREVMIFDYGKGTIPGTNWYSQDNKWWKFDSNAIPFDLAIRAFAEGDNLPKTDIGASNLVSPDVIRQDVPCDYSFTMRNYGTETVKNIKYSILANGEIYDEKEISGIDFPNNKEMNVEIKGISFPKEGNNTLGIEITEINGCADTDNRDNNVETPVYSIPTDAKGFKRNVLFEEYTTENDAGSISADSVYRMAVKSHSNVKWVKHHLGGDKFFNDSEDAYSWMFENNKTFYPAITVDRNVFEGLNERGPAYFVGHEDIVADLFDISSKIKSFVVPQASVHFDSSTRTMEISVDIKSEVCEMPLQKDLRLTVYLVEDSIVSTTQSGASKFIQNGVIRDIVSEAWGDPVDISSHSCSKSYTYSVPSEWNYKNMRIIAFVNNYDKDNPQNCMVYNTCEAFADTANGIDDITADNKEAIVWYDGVTLHVTEGFRITGIYDATGISLQNVVKGINLVKITSDNGIDEIKKMVIK